MAPIHLPTPSQEHLVVTNPLPHILLLRLNRPASLNAMSNELEQDLEAVLDWFESCDEFWTCVVTGTGKAFCVGQDLKQMSSTPNGSSAVASKVLTNPHGFGSLSRRRSSKPVVIAVNGMALGGGAEILVNGDVVIGGAGCKVAFPEVKVGIAAGAGGILNLAKISPRLLPYIYTGTTIPQHLVESLLFTETVPVSDVLARALEWAALITDASPDGVRVSKEQVNLLHSGEKFDDVLRRSAASEAAVNMRSGENVKEGMRAFAERRDPVWKNPAARAGKL